MPQATVDSVLEYTITDTRVEFECEVTFDDGEASAEDTATLPPRTNPVTLEFFGPRTFRFELDASPEIPAGDTTLELSVEDLDRTVDLAVREEEGHLHLKTTALEVVIGLDEWSFQVRDADGKRLLAEQRGDVTAKAERRAAPLGYDAEMTNRWPYRLTGAGTSFVLGADEHIYGFGETFTGFDKRGQTVDCWITQANGTETGHSYKSVPLYLSTAGYGLLLDTNQRATVDVGDSSVVSTEISVADDTFAFVFLGGPKFTDILDRYTALTGRPGAVPRWSYGVWFSRLGYESREEVQSVLDEADRLNLPVDVVHLDPPWLDGLCDLTWDEEAFSDPRDFVATLHERGVRLSLWEYPYLLSETTAFTEAVEHDYLVSDGTGAPYLLDRLSWSGDRGGIVDFTDPEAAAWWAERHEPLVEMGVDAFKCDFGEYLPQDAVLADGTSGKASRNRYPGLYTETVYEAVEAAGGEPLLWARSGWAGGQRFPVHWGGDPATTFESMAASIRGGLSLGLSGYGFWSADIGGFKGTPSIELYVRWAQFGLLANSHARFHGTTPREPWHFGERATDIVRRYATERYRLLPYLETLGVIATERGLPVMRPLVLAFQDDHGAQTCADQVMLGQALMIAPVCSPGGRTDVYLPPGEWIDYWDHTRLTGGRTVRRDLNLEELPVYLRAGTVHPRGEAEIDDPGEVPDALTLQGALYQGRAEGEVYDPAGGDLRRVTLHRQEARLRIEAHLEVDVTVHVVALEDKPNSVSLDGTELQEVAEQPGPGEWAYDSEGDSLRAVEPSE